MSSPTSRFAAEMGPAIARPQATAAVSVDWSDPVHRAAVAKPCRFDDGDTEERDEQGRPCHRQCAEHELARELLGSASPGGAFTDERTDTHALPRRGRPRTAPPTAAPRR